MLYKVFAMSDLIISPKTNPDLAAQQIVIELIRTGHIEELIKDGSATHLLKIFDQIEKHFFEKYHNIDTSNVTRIK